MHNVIDAKSKLQAHQKRNLEIEKLAKSIDAMFAKGRVDMDDDGAVRGCGGRFFCGLFNRARRTAQTSSTLQAGASEQRAQSATESRIFGRRGKQESASDKLSQAVESVAVHVEQLSEKAQSARGKAKELFAAGKQADAMIALKRAKMIEKQVESASSTHIALERQMDVLAESALQKEVASALSTAVASTKKKTKGLLTKAEDAADGATELKDFAEDVAQALGSIQMEVYDDDDLMQELHGMVHSDGETDTAPVVASGVAISATPVIEPTSYPKAPTKRVEKRALLSDDSAQETSAT